jgi:hypothetical protein
MRPMDPLDRPATEREHAWQWGRASASASAAASSTARFPEVIAAPAPAAGLSGSLSPADRQGERISWTGTDGAEAWRSLLEALAGRRVTLTWRLQLGPLIGVLLGATVGRRVAQRVQLGERLSVLLAARVLLGGNDVIERCDQHGGVCAADPNRPLLELRVPTRLAVLAGGDLVQQASTPARVCHRVIAMRASSTRLGRTSRSPSSSGRSRRASRSSRAAASRSKFLPRPGHAHVEILGDPCRPVQLGADPADHEELHPPSLKGGEQLAQAKLRRLRAAHRGGRSACGRSRARSGGRARALARR